MPLGTPNIKEDPLWVFFYGCLRFISPCALAFGSAQVSI